MKTTSRIPHTVFTASTAFLANRLFLPVLGISLTLSQFSHAQRDDEGGGGRDEGGEGGEHCLMGTALSNGSLFARTEPNPNGYVDPGLSIIDPFDDYGMLAGSSMQVQWSGGNTTGPFPGLSTLNDHCVESATLTTPTHGGSSRGFWDNNSGVATGIYNGPVTQPGLNHFACFQTNSTLPGTSTSAYLFEYTLTLSPNTQVDGIYWEMVDSGAASGNFYVYLDGVLIDTRSPGGGGLSAPGSGPDYTGNVDQWGSSSTATVSLQHYFSSINQTLSGQHTFSVYKTGNDPIFGDFAVLGCCEAVPEPATSAMLGLGACALAFRRRKQ